MSAFDKPSRQASKRKVSDSLTENEHGKKSNLESIGDLADNFAFLAPNELCPHAIGLFFCLTNKQLINLSFSNLYRRSLVHDWISLLARERRNLKRNINSIEKCFILNRLIHECTKNPTEFVQHSANLYAELTMRMTSTIIPFPTAEHLYNEIRAYRYLLYQQRLFYINQNENRHSYTFLSLQQAISKLCSQLIDSYEIDHKQTQIEQWNQLKELLQHSFVIIAEPSTSECVAAVKYEKMNNTYTARLTSRIICLLDANIIHTHFVLSSMGVTLYPLDRQIDNEGERQVALEWKTKQIFDANGYSKLFYYAELQTIKLTKPDGRSNRPLYKSTLCQLQFQLNISMNNSDFQENLTLLSRPFGVCSHAQYFPEYVAKVIIYEIEQRPQNMNHLITPDIMTDSICDYHTRITGIKPKVHTKQFIFQQCQVLYEERKNTTNIKSSDVYENILSKLISQIEFYVDHPVLSIMYHDNLFLGIYNSIVDQLLNGSREQLHILLRFDTLAEHQSTQQASVRYIVHNGELIKAAFHSKAFIDDMCRMICESITEKAKRSRILSTISDRNFYDFSTYFNKELYRLSSVAPPTKETYKPLIPVLWSTMRSTDDEQLTKTEASVISSTSSSTNEDESSRSSTTTSDQTSSFDEASATIHSSTNLNQKINLETNKLIHFLLDKLPEMFLNVETMTTSSNANTKVTSSNTTKDIIEQRKLFLSNLLHNYLQSISHIQASTQMKDKTNDSKSYTFYCSSSTNT
ncbi:hypothetical protein I4U23_007962 [Adineta vaga]|nr:hypothetical protein I4U23_007962 [Adineta vaga]